jgi:hypothetical protein
MTELETINQTRHIWVKKGEPSLNIHAIRKWITIYYIGASLVEQKVDIKRLHILLHIHAICEKHVNMAGGPIVNVDGRTLRMEISVEHTAGLVEMQVMSPMAAHTSSLWNLVFLVAQAVSPIVNHNVRWVWVLQHEE